MVTVKVSIKSSRELFYLSCKDRRADPEDRLSGATESGSW